VWSRQVMTLPSPSFHSGSIPLVRRIVSQDFMYPIWNADMKKCNQTCNRCSYWMTPSMSCCLNSNVNLLKNSTRPLKSLVWETEFWSWESLQREYLPPRSAWFASRTCYFTGNLNAWCSIQLRCVFCESKIQT